MKPARITVKELVDLDACESQVDRFRSMFGSSVEITEENARKAANAYTWAWVIKHFLTPEQRKVYFDLCDADWARHAKLLTRPGVTSAEIYESLGECHVQGAINFVRAYYRQNMKTAKIYPEVKVVVMPEAPK